MSIAIAITLLGLIPVGILWASHQQGRRRREIIARIRARGPRVIQLREECEDSGSE